MVVVLESVFDICICETRGLNQLGSDAGLGGN